MTLSIVSQGVVNVLAQNGKVVIAPLAMVSQLTPDQARKLAAQIAIAADIADVSLGVTALVRNDYGFPTFRNQETEHERTGR